MNRERYETMRLGTAAPLYDISVDRLRRMCTRGEVKSTLVGGDHFVTPAEMDRVFKGVEAPKAKAKVASKKPTKVVG